MSRTLIFCASLASVLCFLHSTSAQTLSLGKDFETKKHTPLFFPDAVDKQNVYAHELKLQGFKFASNYYRFDRGSLDLQETWDPFKNDKGDARSTTTVCLKEATIIFYEYTNKETRKQELYARKMGSAEGTEVKITESDEMVKSIKVYNVVANYDSSRVCVISDYKETDENSVLSIKVFTADLKEVSSCRANLPLNAQFRNSQTLFLGKEKSLATGDGMKFLFYKKNLIMGPVFLSEKKKNEKFQPALFAINVENGSFEEVDVKGDKNFRSIDFALESSGDLVCAGFYCNEDNGNKNLADGVYTCRIKDGITPGETYFMPLPEKIIKEYNNNTFDNDHSGPKRDFKIKKLVPRKGGGSIVLAERAFLGTTQTTKTDGYISTTYALHHEGIIAFDLSLAAVPSWFKILPMRQVYLATDNFGSFMCAYTDKKMYLIYNDTEKNRKNGVTTYDDAKTHNDKHVSIPALAELDYSGDYTIKALPVKFGDEENIIESQYFFNPRSNEIIFAVMFKDSGKMARLLFEN